ncbi:MAG: hypothetical protein H0W83_13810 [Planctomycetes bacterium]|nr:hypothetical protein [Planctomycetota bacterium]
MMALLTFFTFFACGCSRAEPNHGGWFALRWIERPSTHGPSTTAPPEDVCSFVPCGSFDRGIDDDAAGVALASLREGDVIAYRLPPSEARREIAHGNLNVVGYRVLKYGHLAMVVADPEIPGRLCLFSSESFKGPNTGEGLETLAAHHWDAYRLDRWKRVDTARIRDFVRISHDKAGHWYGYDFSGMFGLWNSNLRPERPEQIGHDYICSTIVVACLWYAGVHLDAVRGQIGDLCSPNQVVTSHGALVPPPDAELVIERVAAP